MNKNEITTGTYYYKLPHWTSSRFVDVSVNVDGIKVVSFEHGMGVINLADIPENAEFTELFPNQNSSTEVDVENGG